MKSRSKWAEENLSARDIKELSAAWRDSKQLGPRRRHKFAELGIILAGSGLFTPFGQRL